MIDVKFNFNNKSRNFGLQVYHSDEQERLVFFVQTDNGGILAAEKLSGKSA